MPLPARKKKLNRAGQSGRPNNRPKGRRGIDQSRRTLTQRGSSVVGSAERRPLQVLMRHGPWLVTETREEFSTKNRISLWFLF